MTGYEEFQKIMAEIKYRIKNPNDSLDFINKLFNSFKK